MNSPTKIKMIPDKNPQLDVKPLKVLLVANTSWFLQNFQLPFIKEVQSRGAHIIAVAPFDQGSSRFKDIGIRHIDVPMSRRGLNPLSDLLLIMRLYKIYKREKPDYVFHNTVKPVIYGSVAARYAHVNGVLNMIPGLGYVFVGQRIHHKLLRFLVKRMYKFALKSSRKVFFQNPDDHEYFLQHSLVENRLTEVTYGLGVDLDHFQYSDARNDGDVCTFLLVARMLWDKGIGEFVEAAKMVRETFPNTRFQLLGKIDEDNPRHIEKEIIDQWHKSGVIEYLGERADVRTVVANADVVVLPSFYREGVPNSLMEAMAMGKPIITTDTPGCRETVVQGVNGILIPPRDIRSLAKAMEIMVVQPEKRIVMGKESRKLVVERFDVTRVNSMILRAMNI